MQDGETSKRTRKLRASKRASAQLHGEIAKKQHIRGMLMGTKRKLQLSDPSAYQHCPGDASELKGNYDWGYKPTDEARTIAMPSTGHLITTHQPRDQCNSFSWFCTLQLSGGSWDPSLDLSTEDRRGSFNPIEQFNACSRQMHATLGTENPSSCLLTS